MCTVSPVPGVSTVMMSKPRFSLGPVDDESAGLVYRRWKAHFQCLMNIYESLNTESEAVLQKNKRASFPVLLHTESSLDTFICLPMYSPNVFVRKLTYFA